MQTIGVENIWLQICNAKLIIFLIEFYSASYFEK